MLVFDVLLCGCQKVSDDFVVLVNLSTYWDFTDMSLHAAASLSDIIKGPQEGLLDSASKDTTEDNILDIRFVIEN